MLKGADIKVVTESKLHFKAVIIDNEVLYLGSINPLGIIVIKYVPPDYMVRFESEALVDEIIENAIGKELYENGLARTLGNNSFKCCYFPRGFRAGAATLFPAIGVLFEV